MRKIFKHYSWNHFYGLLTVIGFMDAKFGNTINTLLSNVTTNDLVQYLLLFLALFFFARGLNLSDRGGKKNNEPTRIDTKYIDVLKDIADSKRTMECPLWDYNKYGYSAVPVTETWNEWVTRLVRDIKNPETKIYNFGDHFYFFDFDTGKEIKIPTDGKSMSEKVGASFKNGMVLRLMPRET